jgi:hypothetical protein
METLDHYQKKYKLIRWLKKYEIKELYIEGDSDQATIKVNTSKDVIAVYVFKNKKQQEESTIYNKLSTPYSRFGAFAPRSGQELEVDSRMQLAAAGKRIQPDTPAPPNRVAAGPSDLRVVGRREYNNVM